MLLFLDTETTDKMDFNLPVEHPSQPRLVQIAAQLVDPTTHEVVSTLNSIIRPDGWRSSEGAQRVHRITHEYALAFGIPLADVLAQMWELIARANQLGQGRLIAHNIQFDNRMMLREAAATGSDVTALAQLRPFCTMRSLTLRMKLKGRWPGKYKWPTLDEAFRYCFPQKEIDAETRHSAMTDLLACKDVFMYGRKEGWWQ